MSRQPNRSLLHVLGIFSQTGNLSRCGRSPVNRRRQARQRRQREFFLETLEPRMLLATVSTLALDFIPGEILIGFNEDVATQVRSEGLSQALKSSTASWAALGLDQGELLVQHRNGPKGQEGLLTRWKLSSGKDVLDTVRELSQLPGVSYAEPNYIWSNNALPNDPSFDSLWGLHNTGQTGGTLDADIDALEAWELGTGSRSVIVGVIDTGVDYSHPDLVANIWNNPGECLAAGGSCTTDGIDNDGNGYVDDFHGINAITGSGDPMDDNLHGTHVAGTIGALGNNALGVVGVNHQVTIAACKFLGASGSGATTDAVECFQYFNSLKQAGHNVVVTNNSWSGTGFSQALIDAMTGPAGMAPILHAAAAGNANHNNDVTPYYPASYDLANIISVAATDHADNYASFSSYGPTTIDLAAPGVSILSTTPGNTYASLSGTSMATPHVAGAAALVKSLYPALTATQLKLALMAGTDIVSDATKATSSNGRLNVHQSLTNLTETDVTSPDPVTDLAVVEMGMLSATLTWTAHGDDGALGQARMYDVRFSTSPISSVNWSSATPAVGEPRPGTPGTIESFQFKGLQRDTNYYFGIKVVDNLGNESLLSNLVTGRTTLGESVLADGFESGLGDWDAQSPWGLTTSVRRSGSYSVTDSPSGNYANNANTSLTSAPIDLAGFQEAHLTFWHRYDLEQGYDFGRFEISVNGGTSWTTLASYTGAASSFQKAEFDLSAYAGSPSLLMRFRLESETSIQRDGWYVDDLQLAGMRTSGVQVNSANAVEGDAGTTQLQFTVTRFGDPSTAFTVGYDTISQTATSQAILGTLTFNRHAIAGAADSAASVAAADIDGDGDVDVVAASINDDTIAWHENDGNGNFVAHVITNTADGARFVVTADVDSDGDTDILSASWYDDTIAWYENNGAGSFVAHVITNTADGTQSVFAADMDGDGDLDVLSASTLDDTVAWYENGGNQNFTAHPITTTLDYATSVYAADVDGDGDRDVLAVSVFGDKIEWYENDGNENFVAHPLSTSVDNPWSVFPADLDGDGDIDILGASAEDDTIRWFENLGNTNFTPHTVTDTADNLRSVTAADMDNDGDADILSASLNDDTVAWYENDGNGNFIARAISIAADGAGSVLAADVDGDGDLDVIAASRFDDSVAWFSNSLINPEPADYQAASGTLSFAVGETEKAITVTIFGDTAIETDEIFFVKLANTTAGVAIADGLGIGKILNDDQPIVLFADSFEVGEWNGLWVEDSQNDWLRSSQRATNGSFAAEVDGSASNATLTTANVIDVSGMQSATLTFDWWIESGFDSGEYLALDVSTNNGASWTQDVRRLNGNVSTENVWHSETVDLTPYRSANLKVRFRSKVSAADEDANVDNVRIVGIAEGPNTPPVAVAGGPYSVNEGSSVVLSGAGSSDPDGSIASYAWDLDNDGQYDDASGISVNFATTVSGVHSVGLQVTDNRGATATTTASVTVNNVAPTANAGSDLNGFVGTQVGLSAANSTDPGDDITSYAWDLDNDGQYDDATGVSTAFTAVAAGSYQVGVRVTDADGAFSTDSVLITITEAPSEVILFEDSFEVSEWNGLWVEDSQNDFFRSTQRATTGTHSAEVDGLANNATLTIAAPINLSGYTAAELTFDWWIESGFDTGEYLALDISTNGGTTWQSDVRRLDGNVSTENVWHQETVNLIPYPSTNLKFRFRSKVSDSREDANVDNVRVVASATTGGAAMAFMSTPSIDNPLGTAITNPTSESIAIVPEMLNASTSMAAPSTSGSSIEFQPTQQPMVETPTSSIAEAVDSALLGMEFTQDPFAYLLV